MSTVTAMSNAGNCVYCNQRVYENGEFKHVADRLVKEHHATCEKHPMRALEQRIKELEAMRGRHIASCSYCEWRKVVIGGIDEAFREVHEHEKVCERHPMYALAATLTDREDLLIRTQEKALQLAFDKSALTERVKALEIVVKERRATMTLRDLQEEQRLWVEHNFGSDRPSYMPLLGAVEELGELAHAHLKGEQGIRISENHEEKAKDAVADVVIYLADYCSSRGFDFQELVQSTWEQVRKRDWKADPVSANVSQLDLPLGSPCE